MPSTPWRSRRTPSASSARSRSRASSTICGGGSVVNRRDLWAWFRDEDLTLLLPTLAPLFAATVLALFTSTLSGVWVISLLVLFGDGVFAGVAGMFLRENYKTWQEGQR